MDLLAPPLPPQTDTVSLPWALQRFISFSCQQKNKLLFKQQERGETVEGTMEEVNVEQKGTVTSEEKWRGSVKWRLCWRANESIFPLSTYKAIIFSPVGVWVHCCFQCQRCFLVPVLSLEDCLILLYGLLFRSPQETFPPFCNLWFICCTASSFSHSLRSERKRGGEWVVLFVLAPSAVFLLRIFCCTDRRPALSFLDAGVVFATGPGHDTSVALSGEHRWSEVVKKSFQERGQVLRTTMV